MSDLVDFVIDRHGGMHRWEHAVSVSAQVHVYGGFWGYKGQPDLLGHELVTADVHRQHISMRAFDSARTLQFDRVADRVEITDRDGRTVDELIAPRASMAGYAGDTPWTPSQTGYFISYASWMYLLEPFVFTLPDVETQEIEPWGEDGEIWRRLEVSFPGTIASHSTMQTYYFDSKTGLQRRMDYDVEVNGWANVAHYTSEHRTFGEMVVPTRRRVLLRNGQNIADHRSAAILLDVGHVRFLH